MSINRVFCRALVIGAVVVLASCSSTKFVKVTVDPPEAEIFLNGEKVGTGSYEKILDFSKSPTIQFVAKLDKFADGTVDVSCEPETETEYAIKLTRLYSITVPLMDFSAQKTRTGMKIGLKRLDAIAYYDSSGKVKGLTQVTMNKSANVYYGGPVLAPNEDNVLYRYLKVDGKATDCQIVRQKVGTKSTTKLVSEKRWLALFPSITPDGLGYVYCSNRITGKYVLWRKKFKGTARGRLSNGETQDFSPSVSPNGSKVVFTSLPDDGEELQVCSIDVNSGLSSQVGNGYDPQVSPDGRTIMFLIKSPDSKRSQIWTMDFDGGEKTQLTPNDDYDIKDPRWSPDGKVIVFSSNKVKDDKGRQNFDIWMMNVDGSNEKQLTFNGSHDDKPCFDRHGEQIFFRSNRGTKWNIWSFKVDERRSDKRRAFNLKK